MKRDLLQHDGKALRSPEDRRWMYEPGYSIRGLRFARDAERDEDGVRWEDGVVFVFAMVGLAVALGWAVGCSSPGLKVDADVSTTAHDARESTLGLGPELSNAGGGRE